MQIETTKTGPVVMTRRATFQFDGNSMVAIEVSSGAIEIYQVDPTDGLEMFRGYISDVSIPGRLRANATTALYIFQPEYVRQVQLTLNLDAA